MEFTDNLKSEGSVPSRNIFDTLIRIASLAFLLFWSFKIIEPFIGIFIWSVIFAVALYPLFTRFSRRMKKAWAATTIALILLLIIVVPTIWLAASTADDITKLRDRISENGLVINPPPENIKNIPVIGRKLDETWLKASTDFSQVAQENKERIKNVLVGFFGLLSSIVKGILLLAAAVILGAVLMYFGQPAGNFANAFFRRLAGEDGADMAKVAEVTIRNVTRGILGVAFIQSMLAGIGMVIGGVPLAGLWTLLCLMLAIVQIPILPVAAGVIIYLWTSDTSTAMAVIISVWMLIVGLLDNVLKPIMLGKGAPVPMLVVFLGAIGGFIFTGFTGLFTGAIVLSLAYKLFDKWMKSGSTSEVMVVSSTAPQ